MRLTAIKWRLPRATCPHTCRLGPTTLRSDASQPRLLIPPRTLVLVLFAINNRTFGGNNLSIRTQSQQSLTLKLSTSSETTLPRVPSRTRTSLCHQKDPTRCHVFPDVSTRTDYSAIRCWPAQTANTSTCPGLGPVCNKLTGPLEVIICPTGHSFGNF